MKKVFLSTSFSQQVKYDNGEVSPEFRGSLEHILKALREEAGVEVFCAIEAEDWKLAANVPPEVGVKKDFEELSKVDLLLALVHDRPSVGVQSEIGYMVAKGRQVILAVEAGHELAYFNQGLVGSGFVTLITYDDAASLAKQLTIAVNTPETV